MLRTTIIAAVLALVAGPAFAHEVPVVSQISTSGSSATPAAVSEAAGRPLTERQRQRRAFWAKYLYVVPSERGGDYGVHGPGAFDPESGDCNDC